VLFEQVRPHDHAHVAQRQEELLVLIDRHQRSRDVSVHHADAHHGTRIDVTAVTSSHGGVI
jgi:hypothetical protein